MTADLAASIRDVKASRGVIIEQANTAVRELLERNYPAMRGFALLDEQYRPRVTIELDLDLKKGMVVATASVTGPTLRDTIKRKIEIPDGA